MFWQVAVLAVGLLLAQRGLTLITLLALSYKHSPFDLKRLHQAAEALRLVAAPARRKRVAVFRRAGLGPPRKGR